MIGRGLFQLILVVMDDYFILKKEERVMKTFIQKSVSLLVIWGVICVTMAFGILGSAHANLILNSGFEIPDVSGSWVTYSSGSVPADFEWTIAVDWINHINTNWQGVSGTPNLDGFDQSVDIDAAAELSQSISTTPGNTYRLRFAYSHNYRASQSTGYVNIIGSTDLLSETIVHDIPNSSLDMKWLTFEDTFIADSSNVTLTFTGDPDNGPNGFYGFVVDDVSVSIVPIPPAILLLGSGLLGLARFRMGVRGVRVTSQ